MDATDIRSNEAALAAATVNNWKVCAEEMRKVSVKQTPRKCGSKESCLVVKATGADPFTMMEKLRTDATGNLLYLRLADGSSEGGVVWAEPDLTVPYMQARVADFTQPVIDALVGLSAPVAYPYAEATAEQCKEAIDLQTLTDKRAAMQQRFDVIKNQIGTVEQPLAVVALRAMADEWVV